MADSLVQAPDDHVQALLANPTPANIDYFKSYYGYVPDQLKTSAVGVAGREAARNIGTAAGGVTGAGIGQVIGGGLGALTTPITGPFGEPIGQLLGGLAGGYFGGTLGRKVQDKSLEQVPEIAAQLGLTNNQEQLDIQQHPYAAAAGALAPQVLAFNPASGITRSSAILGGAIGAGQEAVSEEASGNDLDLGKIAIGAVGGAALGHPNRIGRVLLSPGEALGSTFGQHAVPQRVDNSIPSNEIDLSTQEQETPTEQSQSTNDRQSRIDFLTQKLSQLNPKTDAYKVYSKALKDENFLMNAGPTIDQLGQEASEAKDKGLMDIHDELIAKRLKILNTLQKIHKNRDETANALGQTDENLSAYQNGTDSGTDIPALQGKIQDGIPAHTPVIDNGTDPAALQGRVEASKPSVDTSDRGTDPSALQARVEASRAIETESGKADPAALQEKIEKETGKPYIQKSGETVSEANSDVTSGNSPEKLHREDLAQVKTGSDAMEIIKNTSQNGFYRLLATKLQPFAETINHTVIHPDEQFPASDEVHARLKSPTNAALHDTSNSTSYFKDQTMGVGHGVSEENVMHETLHGVLNNKIDIGKNVKYKGTLLGNAVDDLHDLRNKISEHIALTHAKISSTDHPDAPRVAQQLAWMHDIQVADPKELVAYGLTNKHFQEYLQTIKITPKLNAWSRFVQIVRDILGMPKGVETALSRLMDVSNKLIESPNPEGPGSGISASTIRTLTDVEKDKRMQDILKEPTLVSSIKEELASLKTGSKQTWDGVKKLFSPQSRSAEAGITARSLRNYGSDVQINADRARTTLNKAADMFRHFTKEQSLSFMDVMESGKKFNDPRLQRIAETLKEMMDEKFKEATKVDPDAMNKYLENYFPHIWKDTDAAIRAFQTDAVQKRLEGSKAFQKDRILPTITFGIHELGLEPKTFNPVEAVLIKMQEMDKFILGRKLVNEYTENGLAKKFEKGDIVPPGYKKLDGVIGKIFYPDSVGVGELQSRSTKGLSKGDWYVPEDVAAVLENHLSPGLRSQAAFRGYLSIANVLNQAQLGLSAFHLGFTTLDAATSSDALALEYLSKGQMGKAAKTYVSGFWNPLLPIVDTALGTKLSTGSKVLDEWYHPGSQGHEIAQLVEAARTAGGRAGLDGFYATHHYDSMVHAFQQGNILKGTALSPLAGLEKISSIIMEGIVPKQKMQVFSKLAEKAMRELPENASKDDVRKAMALAWDSVDNRMGQMVYDNLFWNKTVKDLSLASVRSLGWNIGTIREIAGGIKDFAKLPMAEQKVMTHRMAYVIALPLRVGLMGAVINYLFTGQAPKELKDYFFPRTGETDITGKPLRLSLPSYMKDIYQFSHQPMETVSNKANPLISMISDMMQNKDYYGTEIVHPDDPLIQKGLEELEFIGKQALPFGIRNAMQESNANAPLSVKIAGFFGAPKAPYWLEQTKAEQMAAEIVHERLPVGARTKEQFEKSQVEREIINGLQNSDYSVREQAIKQQNEAFMNHQLNSSDLKKIHDKVSKDPLTAQIQDSRLTASDTMRIYNVATPEEQDRIKGLVLGKIIRSQGLTPEEKQTMIKQVQGTSN